MADNRPAAEDGRSELDSAELADSGRNCDWRAGDSGEDTDVSVCGEKGDMTTPLDDLNGPSRAMTASDRVYRG